MRHALPALLFLLVLLAGCGGGGAERASERWAMSPSACTAALARTGALIQPWPEAPRRGHCAVTAPLTLAATPVARFERPVKTSCAMALALARLLPEWDRLARGYFDSGIAAVRGFGSYSCRGMSGNRGRMSLHASARAFDLRGFRLDDGRVVDIEDHWSEWGAKGRFVRRAARAACGVVNLVLTPNSDRHHQDHLHLDLGPWRRCDA